MSPGRSSTSIRRMLAGVALIGLGLAAYRAWTCDSWWLGELILPLETGIIGLTFAFLTSGRTWRFFSGFGSTGVIAGLAFWVAPLSSREFVLDRILIPIDDRFSPHWPGFISELSGSLLSYRLISWETGSIWPTRSPFLSRESQVWLGGLELSVAIVGGLVWAAISRNRAARPAVVLDP